MYPFNHAQLEIRYLMDTGDFVVGLSNLVNEEFHELYGMPLVFHTGTFPALERSLLKGLSIDLHNPNVGPISLQYDSEKGTLDVRVNSKSDRASQRKASEVFNLIKGYIVSTRSWGTYEIEPNVGLNDKIGKGLSDLRALFS